MRSRIRSESNISLTNNSMREFGRDNNDNSDSESSIDSSKINKFESIIKPLSKKSQNIIRGVTKIGIVLINIPS